MKDIGDMLADEILEQYWDGEDFEEWVEYKFSRKLAKLITGAERQEAEKRTEQVDPYEGAINK
jgi:hypothetical protein